MNVRFYVDAETEAPHIHKHGVDDDEVVDVLTNPGEDRPGRKGRGSSLAKPEWGAIFGSFMCLILSPTVYL